MAKIEKLRPEKFWKEAEKDFKEQDKILKRWMERNYGKRCKEYDKNCIVCKMWKIADKLILQEGKTELHKCR